MPKHNKERFNYVQIFNIYYHIIQLLSPHINLLCDKFIGLHASNSVIKPANIFFPVTTSNNEMSLWSIKLKLKFKIKSFAEIYDF